MMRGIQPANLLQREVLYPAGPIRSSVNRFVVNNDEHTIPRHLNIAFCAAHTAAKVITN
jgi:hypothetical protein